VNPKLFTSMCAMMHGQIDPVRSRSHANITP